MKTLALAIFLVPILAQAATVEGSYFRLSAEALIVDAVLVRGAESLHVKSADLHHSFTDYYLRLGAGRALIREGDVVLFDPDSMDAEVEFSHEEVIEGFRVLTMVIRYKEEVAAAVMICPAAGPVYRDNNPGVYSSVRAKDFIKLLPAFTQFALGSELRFKKPEYRSLNAIGFAPALRPLEALLKEKAKQPLKTATAPDKPAAPQPSAGKLSD